MDHVLEVLVAGLLLFLLAFIFMMAASAYM
jgi:hypothetical protein